MLYWCQRNGGIGASVCHGRYVCDMFRDFGRGLERKAMRFPWIDEILVRFHVMILITSTASHIARAYVLDIN